MYHTVYNMLGSRGRVFCELSNCAIREGVVMRGSHEVCVRLLRRASVKADLLLLSCGVKENKIFVMFPLLENFMSGTIYIEHILGCIEC